MQTTIPLLGMPTIRNTPPSLEAERRSGHLNQREVVHIHSSDLDSRRIGPGLLLFILVGLFCTIVAGLAVGYTHDSILDGSVIALLGLALTLLTSLFIHTVSPSFQE